MKYYVSPEIEFIDYETEECLESSSIIPKESEDIGGVLNELA